MTFRKHLFCIAIKNGQKSVACVKIGDIIIDNIGYLQNRYHKPPISYIVTLNKNENYVHIETTVDNVVKDHRLRLKLPTQICSDSYFTGQAFYLVNRPTNITIESQQRYEQESVEKNMNGIIGVRDEKGRGLAFVSAEGLHEGQVDSSGNIYVTLLRSFHKVFNESNAKNSQLQQELTYNYVIAPVSKETEYSDLLRIQNRISNTDIFTFYKTNENPELKNEFSYISVANKNIATSVIKKSEEEKGIVIRVFNPTDNEQSTDVLFGFDFNEAFETNLNEEIIGNICQNGNKLHLTLKPWQIKTVMIK